MSTSGGRPMQKPIAKLVLGSALLIGCATPAYAEWIELETSRPWVAEYEKESCALSRYFGEGDDELLLHMRQFGPTTHYRVTIIGPRISKRRFQPEIRLGDDGEFVERPDALRLQGSTGFTYSESFIPQEISVQLEVAPPAPRELYWSEQAERQRVAQITSIAIRRAFRDDYVLQTGSLAEPFAAMRTCMSDLIAHWGYDPEVQNSLTRSVQTVEFEEWVKELTRRYPTAALLNGRQAIVQARLAIDAEGKALQCFPQTDENDSLFDDLACELLLKHARFDPALDGEGRPVPSFYVVSLRYVMGQR